MKNCRDCRFAVHMDYGYSNYTVEGTTFACGKDQHPDGAFDEFYGEEKKLLYAESCPLFESGDGIRIDVEGDNVTLLSSEERELYETASKRI